MAEHWGQAVVMMVVCCCLPAVELGGHLLLQELTQAPPTATTNRYVYRQQLIFTPALPTHLETV